MNLETTENCDFRHTDVTEYLPERDIVLSHWDRDKMAAIFQTTFWMGFLGWKFINFV